MEVVSLLDLASKVAAPEPAPSGREEDTKGKHYSALLLWAPWHPPAVQLKAMTKHLQNDLTSINFYTCDIDTVPDVATKHNVTLLPQWLLYHDGVEVHRVTGSDPPMLIKTLKALTAGTLKTNVAGGTAAAPATGGVSMSKNANTESTANAAKQVDGQADRLQARLKALTNASPVMFFIKGSRTEPYCRFSKSAMGTMKDNYSDVQFGTFDIFTDEAVWQGLKEYSKWPTFPQLYVKGELVGGHDIMMEMHTDGSLRELFDTTKPKDDPLEKRLRDLVTQEKIMIFMKGSPATPKCKFSKELMRLLGESGVKEFGHFDILTDDDVRQGLKKLYKWPTFPQIYCGGNLLGGLDVVREIIDSGEEDALRNELEATATATATK